MGLLLWQIIYLLMQQPLFRVTQTLFHLHFSSALLRLLAGDFLKDGGKMTGGAELKFQCDFGNRIGSGHQQEFGPLHSGVLDVSCDGYASFLFEFSG